MNCLHSRKPNLKKGSYMCRYVDAMTWQPLPDPCSLEGKSGYQGKNKWEQNTNTLLVQRAQCSYEGGQPTILHTEHLKMYYFLVLNLEINML